MLWDAKTTGALLDEYDTGAQITHLIWIPGKKLAVVGHGYAIEDDSLTTDLCIWDSSYQKLTQVQRIRSAHSGRILHLAMVPGKLISCGADETLRFWNMQCE